MESSQQTVLVLDEILGVSLSGAGASEVSSRELSLTKSGMATGSQSLRSLQPVPPIHFDKIEAQTKEIEAANPTPNEPLRYAKSLPFEFSLVTSSGMKSVPGAKLAARGELLPAISQEKLGSEGTTFAPSMIVEHVEHGRGIQIRNVCTSENYTPSQSVTVSSLGQKVS